MKSNKSFGILFFLLTSIFVTAKGQAVDNSPEVIAKSMTGWLAKTIKIDSLTATRVYDCFLIYCAESDSLLKEGKEKQAKGTYIKGEYKKKYKQMDVRKDSCLRQILNRSQFDKWKEEENKYLYKQEGR